VFVYMDRFQHFLGRRLPFLGRHGEEAAAGPA